MSQDSEMAVYKKMYLTMFNAVTDAIGKLKDGQTLEAAYLLKQAQLQTEEIYASAPQDGAGEAPLSETQKK